VDGEKRFKVLIVDDVPENIHILMETLKDEFSLVAATGGEKALRLARGEVSPDLILLDVMMPGMDGIETLRKIKQAHPLVEVIMLTGHATVETGIEGMKLGAFDYLMKPCDIDQLMAKVKEAKNKKTQHEDKITQARIQEITLRRGA